MIGIYRITERASGKVYIGQSIHIEHRWRAHHKRFSPDHFDYAVLLLCPIESLDFFETSFISGYDSHRNGFNGTVGGSGIKSKFVSAETRCLIGDVSRGKHKSVQTRKKMSEAHHLLRQSVPSPLRGRPKSEETRQRMSQAAIGNKRSEGHALSEEHCNKLREKALIREEKKRALEIKSKPKSEATREAMRLAWIVRRKKDKT